MKFGYFSLAWKKRKLEIGARENKNIINVESSARFNTLLGSRCMYRISAWEKVSNISNDSKFLCLALLSYPESKSSIFIMLPATDKWLNTAEWEIDSSTIFLTKISGHREKLKLTWREKSVYTPETINLRHRAAVEQSQMLGHLKCGKWVGTKGEREKRGKN